MALNEPLRWQRLDLPSADLQIAQFCAPDDEQSWFDRLQSEITWQRHRLKLFGREVDAPRLSSWVGDAGTGYSYSGRHFAPLAWTSALRELREYLFVQCKESCNSVLCNLYRNGKDSMGWHSDSEKELGPAPVIISFSLGGVRRFRLRHRHNPESRLEIDLPSGSVLRMAGATQRLYRHEVPKTARPVAPRINLTFRTIQTALLASPPPRENLVHTR